MKELLNTQKQVMIEQGNRRIVDGASEEHPCEDEHNDCRSQHADAADAQTGGTRRKL